SSGTMHGMTEGRAQSPRFEDLTHALHTIDVEIERYETILRSKPDRRLGIPNELTKLRSYRGEIIDKLKTIP
ncbi:MAG TPA: hypothetical protein VK760_00495, partial [Candidatus Acidoferrales bacterium]|nr:hypothetical protein [Candidatus Acidoferrales bacterium]